MSGERPGVNRAELRALLGELAELDRPPLAKTQPPSRQEESEKRASVIAAECFDSTEMSQRAIARMVERDERMVRDYRDGSRAVPLSVLLLLPGEAQGAAIIEWLRALPRDIRVRVARVVLTELSADQDEVSANVA